MQSIARSQPLSTSPLIVAKDTFRTLRICFSKLSKTDIPGVPDLLRGNLPTDFTQSVRLLTHQASISNKLKDLANQLLSSSDKNTELVNECFNALQGYSTTTFLNYYHNKATKKNASFEVRTDFLLWCLKEMTKLTEQKQPDKAQSIWRLCRPLIPEHLYQCLNFQEASDQIARTIAYIETYANGRLELKNSLQNLLKPDSTSDKKLIYLLEKIEDEPELFFEHTQYMESAKILKVLASQTSVVALKTRLEPIIKRLESIYFHCVDLQTRFSPDDHLRIEKILLLLPYNMNLANRTADGLVALLRLLLEKLSFSERKHDSILGTILDVVLHIDLEKIKILDRQKQNSHLTLDRIEASLTKAILEDKSPADQPISEDAKFEETLKALFEAFGNYIQTGNILGAAKQSTEIIRAFRKFRAEDNEQAERIRIQCGQFAILYDNLLLRPEKDKAWIQIKNSLRTIKENKLVKVRAALVEDPALQKMRVQFATKKQELLVALEDLKFGQAEILCNELIRLAARLKPEFTVTLQEIQQYIGKNRENWMVQSSAAHAAHLDTTRNELFSLALVQAGHTDRGQSISPMTAERIGTAYQTIQKGARSEDRQRATAAAQEAIAWFTTALEHNATPAKLYFKLSEVYKSIDDTPNALKILEKVWNLEFQPGYFDLIQSLGIYYYRNNRHQDCIKLYSQAATHSFQDDGFEAVLQLNMHMNLIRELINHRRYQEALPLLKALLAFHDTHRSSDSAIFFFSNLENIAFYLLLIPEEIALFSESELRKIMKSTGDAGNKAICLQRLYHTVQNATPDLLQEVKWKIVSGAIISLYSYRPRYNDITGCKRFMEKFPLQVSTHFHLYQTYLAQNNDAEAEKLYEVMLALPLIEGEAACALSDPLETLLSQVERQELNPDRYVVMAKWLVDESKYELAEKFFRKALQLDPAHMIALYGIALLYRETNRNNQAALFFHRLLEAYQELPPQQAHWCLSHLIEIHVQDYMARDAAEAESNFPLVLEYISKQYHDDARKCTARAHLELAALDPKQALNHLGRSIELNADNYLAYGQRAQITNGQPAVSDLLMALKLYPGWYQEGYDRLETILQDSFTPTEAAQVYRQLGEHFLQKNRVSEAIVNLEKGRGLDPTCPLILKLLGDGYAAQKRYQMALLTYAEALPACNDPYQEVQTKYHRLFLFSHYGPYFKESVERIRQLLHELEVAELHDLAHKRISPSLHAKNRRQEVLIHLQNLLNQAMQLLSTCLKQTHESDLPFDFPFRRMDEREVKFTSQDLNTLVTGFKPVHPVYKFLKKTYKKHVDALETFISQANSEKHVGFGEQVRGIQTSILIDTSANTKTTTFKPLYLDATTKKNPTQFCQELIEIFDNYINTILTFLDRRVSQELLNIYIQDTSQSAAIWYWLLKQGWIDETGRIQKIEHQLGLDKVPADQISKLLNYLQETLARPETFPQDPTYFDLEKQSLLPPVNQRREFSAPAINLPEDIAFQMQEARNIYLTLQDLLQSTDFAKHECKILHLHGTLVSKLMNSLDHAMYDYCQRRFAITDLERIELKGLFFPVAGSAENLQNWIEKVFSFLPKIRNVKIMDHHPAFFDFLCNLQPCINPDYEWLGNLHDAANAEKHHRFLPAENIPIVMQQLAQRADIEFYFHAIQGIELLHKTIADFK